MVGISQEPVTLPEGATIEDLFDHYAERFETLRAARPSILFARNRQFSTPETPLSDLDEIAFLPPVSGGSIPVPLLFQVEEDGHIFGLTREQIQTQYWSERLQRPEDGAVVVFEGVVRNNTKGRRTRYLEYEGYEPMAVEQMARIGRDIAREFAIGHIALIHRLGRLTIGEASVAVITTAPHRKPAFEAALAGINRLKHEVPIWKKEFFEDGEIWVEGEWDVRLPRRQA